MSIVQASICFLASIKSYPAERLKAVFAVVVLCLSLAFSFTAATATETREIELTDGSVVTGEVVSLSGGVYTIRSATLGTLRIEASKIRVIRSKGAVPSGDDLGRVKSLQNKMLGDGEIMDSVRALQDDPDFQKLLEDPEVMKAVQTGDIAALLKNPDFMKLLNKQAVQDINRRLGR